MNVINGDMHGDNMYVKTGVERMSVVFECSRLSVEEGGVVNGS